MSKRINISLPNKIWKDASAYSKKNNVAIIDMIIDGLIRVLRDEGTKLECPKPITIEDIPSDVLFAIVEKLRTGDYYLKVDYDKEKTV